MRLVILETPYAGDVPTNIDYAREAMRDCILVHGESPFASHMLLAANGVLEDGDQIERNLLKLQVEEQALVRESDKASKTRLVETRREIAELQEQRDAMRAQWMNEREVLSQLRDLPPKLEELRLESERAKRKGDLGRAAEIEYGRIPEVERQIEYS